MKRLVALIVTLTFPFLFTDGASAMAYDCHSHDIDIANSIQDAIDELASELRQNCFEPVLQSSTAVRHGRDNSARQYSLQLLCTADKSNNNTSSPYIKTQNIFAQSRHRVKYYVYALRHIII